MRSLLFGCGFFVSVVSLTACNLPDDAAQPDAVGTSGSADYRTSRMTAEDAITSEVEAGLLAYPELEREIASGQLEVDTDGSEVTLKGTVGTQAEKETAISAAWSVAGVTDVVDRISIEHQ